LSINVCTVCGGPYYAKGLCKNHYQRAYRQRPEVKEHRRAYAKAYYQRPEVKEYHRAYRQRPEVKEHRRAYLKAYQQKPEVKERQRAYQRKYCPRIPVIDCFEKDRSVTVEMLCERSGAARGYVLKWLGEWQKLGLVIKVEENVYRLNPESPLRMAVDGYFREAMLPEENGGRQVG